MKESTSNPEPELRGYALCTEPRSGSNYLLSLLHHTGVLGKPEEYFNYDYMVRGRPDYPQSPDLQIGQIPTLGRTPNGIYGVKLFGWNFDNLKTTRWAERLPNLSFIYLERRDILGQAISRVRAENTGFWSSFEEKSKQDPNYNYDAIDKTMRSIVLQQQRWRLFFAYNGLGHLTVIYEQMQNNPQLTISMVARYMGLDDVRIDPGDVGLKVQRDDLTKEWRQRFIAESRNLGRFST